MKFKLQELLDSGAFSTAGKIGRGKIYVTKPDPLLPKMWQEKMPHVRKALNKCEKMEYRKFGEKKCLKADGISKKH